MTESATSDFLSRYKSISNKLKKRFLRKVNVAEPSDQFAALAAQCGREEMGAHAALCELAAARCEAALGRGAGEAQALARAGRHLMAAHDDSRRLGLVSPGNELLEGALNSLSQASEACPERPLAAGLALETGRALAQDPDARHLAPAALREAATLARDTPSLAVHALLDLATARIETGDLDGALSTLNEIVEIIPDPSTGVYADIMLSCEVSRVLVLLSLQLPGRSLSAANAAALERYSWVGDTADSPAWWRGEEVTVGLQSLVMAGDAESLAGAEAALWPHLDATRRRLLRSVVCALTAAADR